jgi:hypothetical protein
MLANLEEEVDKSAKFFLETYRRKVASCTATGVYGVDWRNFLKIEVRRKILHSSSNEVFFTLGEASVAR